MSQIKDLISLLGPNEVKDFVKYLEKRNKRPDAKNIELFKALHINKENEIKVQIGSNAFNVLNKRLYDRLIEYVATKTIASQVSTELSIFKYIVVARKLLVHGKYKLGFKLLSNAEKKATKIEDFTLLNEVYHTLIEYSYRSESINQSEVFQKFETNQKELMMQEKLNMAYSLIRKAFHQNETGSGEIDMSELFSETYASFDIPEEQLYNFKTLYQLAELADIESAYKKNYHNVNIFFIEKVKTLQGGVLDYEKHLIYHIDLLYLIANIFFRKKRFKESMQYLDKMKEQMKRYDGIYYDEREIKYVTLLSLVYNYTNSHTQALNSIVELIDSPKFKTDELSNPLLVQVMIYFQQGDLIAAKKVLIKLNKPDKWYQNTIGMDWLMNKKYLEILLHIELGNTDYADSRILSLNRTYRSYLKTFESFQVVPFLKLVKAFYYNPAQVKSVEFKEKVEKTLIWKVSEQEDLFLMSFYAWLKSKMEDKTIYKTTMDLLGQTS